MMERFYLRRIGAQRYGGLSDCEVGAFTPGLNVVFGPNEAGKSTLSSLVGGVLFGWEEAHGVRNRYRPPEGGRAGWLEWARYAGEGAQPDGGEEGPAAVVRRDEGGATGDASVAGDIDRVTFETLFSLSAEELRSLRRSADVAARLLSAGSGTGASPSSAFVEIEQRIVQATGDVLGLEAQLERKRAQVKAAQERGELLLQEDRERRELADGRQGVAGRIDELNAEVENLVAWRTELEEVDRRLALRRGEIDELESELKELPGTGVAGGGAHDPAAPPLDSRLLALGTAEERVLRDRLDELAEEREKLERVADTAKENAATSSAAYEALMELSEEEVAASQKLRNRTSQAIVSVLLPVAFIAAGVPLFVHGREIRSLSFTALGVGLVVIAVFLAAAAFFVLFRGPREGALEAKRQDAQWVMLQDRKKHDASLGEKAAFEERVSRYLDEVGLSAAEGSIRQARTLLDEAAAQRAAAAAEAQRVSSLTLRIRSGGSELRELEATRSRILDDAGCEPAATARDLDALVRAQSAQRTALLEASEEMSQRFGELSRELQAARSDRTIDQLKLEYYQLRTRLRERKHELVELLLAKRMLERSIVAWENRSQPAVYERAGQLLALITDGRWTEVSTSSTGSLVAVAADGTVRDPRHLSLGTRQQLYLALRIALLLVASDIGANIPVLADDILVNFDAARRAGAARALAELARHRQVIVFTCHEEVAALFPGVTRIDL